MNRTIRGAHRARPPRQHPACPSRGYYPTRHAADEAAARLGSTPAACSRCGGYHLHLPRKGHQP